MFSVSRTIHSLPSFVIEASRKQDLAIRQVDGALGSCPNLSPKTCLLGSCLDSKFCSGKAVPIARLAFMGTREKGVALSLLSFQVSIQMIQGTQELAKIRQEFSR